MPSAYTAKIHDGKPITFAEFALDCARAFMPNVTLRSEGGGGEKIPEAYQPSPFYREPIASLRAELARVEALSADAIDAEARNAWHEAETYRLNTLRDCAAKRDRYNAMRVRVEAWVPPTEQHVGMKRFMLEQLQSSIDFDCIEDYYATPTPYQTGAQWLEATIAELRHGLAYYEQKESEEIQRTRDRNEWNRALRASLADSGR